MSINVGCRKINNIYIGDKPISRVYIGNELIFPDLFYIYISNLKNIGVTFDETSLRKIYESLDSQIKRSAKIILLPVAVSEGVVYGMDNTTGDVVPFTFSRASVATLFDTDKNMQLVGNDVPRIDYGNYSDSVKLLIEKESTNLVLDNTNLLTGLYSSSYQWKESFDWDNVINSPYCAHISVIQSGEGTKAFYNSIQQILDKIYTYSIFCSVNDSYPIVNPEGYNSISNMDCGFSNNGFST